MKSAEIEKVLVTCSNRLGVLHNILKRVSSVKNAKKLLDNYYHERCEDKDLAVRLSSEDSGLIEKFLRFDSRGRAVYDRLKLDEEAERRINGFVTEESSSEGRQTEPEPIPEPQSPLEELAIRTVIEESYLRIIGVFDLGFGSLATILPVTLEEIAGILDGVEINFEGVAIHDKEWSNMQESLGFEGGYLDMETFDDFDAQDYCEMGPSKGFDIGLEEYSRNAIPEILIPLEENSPSNCFHSWMAKIVARAIGNSPGEFIQEMKKSSIHVTYWEAKAFLVWFGGQYPNALSKKDEDTSF